MEITKNLNGGTVVFVVDGKIDGGSSPKLESVLKEYFKDDAKSFEIDMAKVSYISSAGLRVLLGAQKKANAAGVQMILSNVGKPIQEIFDITGFSGILTLK